MNGLTLEQEAALALAWMNQNAGTKNFTDLGISEAFIALRNQGMIEMQTDWGERLPKKPHAAAKARKPAPVPYAERRKPKSFRKIRTGISTLRSGIQKPQPARNRVIPATCTVRTAEKRSKAEKSFRHSGMIGTKGK